MRFFDQFTPEQLRAQYARNLEGLRRLLARAEASGRKVNGQTAEQWRAHVARFERLAAGEPRDVAPFADLQPSAARDRALDRWRLSR